MQTTILSLSLSLSLSLTYQLFDSVVGTVCSLRNDTECLCVCVSEWGYNYKEDDVVFMS